MFRIETVAQGHGLYGEGTGAEEDLVGLEFRAFGVEPFWSLVIGDSRLALTRLDAPGEVEWPYVAPGVIDAGALYRLEDESHGSVEVKISEQRCIDAMSGAYFPYIAKVRLPDETLYGCALEGDLVKR